jgi:hypothetical protein
VRGAVSDGRPYRDPFLPAGGDGHIHAEAGEPAQNLRQREHHGRPEHPQAESSVLQNRALISKRQARQHQCHQRRDRRQAEQQADTVIDQVHREGPRKMTGEWRDRRAIRPTIVIGP